LLQFVRKQSDWEREDGLIFLFFLGLTSFPKPCVNIGAKNYMAYIKERREYDSSLVGMKPDIIPLSKTRIMWRINFEVAT